MTNKKADGGEGWKSQAGLRDDTARVVTYPPVHVKNRWEEKSGSQSLSGWVQEQVVKAELGSEHNSSSNEDQEKQQLKDRVEQLEKELQQHQKTTEAVPEQVISDENLLQILQENPGSKIHEIVQTAVESGKINIASAIEDQLYTLAEQDKAKYRRTTPNGWHTTDDLKRGDDS
jgi:hypothetical protein